MMKVTAEFRGSPDECWEFLKRVGNYSADIRPGSTIGGRKVLAVTTEYVDPKHPDDEILRYKSGNINKRVRVIVTNYRASTERGETEGES